MIRLPLRTWRPEAPVPRGAVSPHPRVDECRGGQSDAVHSGNNSAAPSCGRSSRQCVTTASAIRWHSS
eukprot:2940029-Pyramimonas_sp.AAC.1